MPRTSFLQLFDKRTVLGVTVAIAVYVVLGLVDIFVEENLYRNSRITDFIGSSVRATMRLATAAAIGSYLSRGKSLWPTIVLVVLLWGSILFNQSQIRDIDNQAIPISQLDWIGAMMALVATVVGVRIGQWIRSQVDDDRGIETR
ncbi:MAG: hypothetical protein ACR2QR_08490 [Woeseiaceae bacterium]